MPPILAAILLGAVFGVVVASAIPMASIVAARVSPHRSLLNVAATLLVLGVLLLGAAELLGTYFAHITRGHPAWFWGSFATFFVTIPRAFRLWQSHRQV